MIGRLMKAQCISVSRSLRVVCVAAGAMLVGWAPTYAEEPTPPAPGDFRAPAYPPVSSFALANGIRIVVAERPGTGLVTATLMTTRGTSDDAPGRIGAASLAAELMERGIERLDASALDEAAQALGGQLGTGASGDASFASISVLRDRGDAAVGLLAEMVRTPVFSSTELRKARARRIDALRIAHSDPGALAARWAARIGLAGTPYALPGGGTRASLLSLRRADLVAFHTRAWRPALMTLILAGDVTPAQAQAWAQAHLDDWPSKGPALRHEAGTRLPISKTAPLPEVPPGGVLVIHAPQAAQAAVVGIAPGSACGSPDELTADMANAVFGGGYSARLNQEIRIKRGLSYGASSAAISARRAGWLQASIRTRNDAVAEVVNVLREEFDSLVDAPADAAEVQVRRLPHVSGVLRSIGTNAGLAGLMAGFVSCGQDVQSLPSQIAAYDAITPQQIADFAARAWTSERMRVVVVGNSPRFLPALRQLGVPVVVRNAAALGD